MRFDEIDGEEVEAPGVVDAVGRSIKNTGLLGYADEAEAWLASTFPRTNLDFADAINPSVPTPKGPTYKDALSRIRQVDDITRAAHPTVSTLTDIGVSLVHPLNKVGGPGLRGAMGGGALQGGLQALGDSRANLTDGDVEDYVRAFQDTAGGAALGSLFGAGGYGAGKALQWLGQRSGRALDNARESLFRDEAEAGVREAAERDAPRIAQREAEAAAQAKEQARIEREHGQGLEMNKAVDRRAAKEAERAAKRAARQPRGQVPALTEEPGTRTLGGYRGSAGERRAVNFDRVQAYRERLADPNLSAAERGRLQQYVDAYGDAVDNPGAFERQRIDQELRKRYPSEMVDRIMAERVGPDGAIRSRRSAAPPLTAEPTTQPMVWDDLKPQGFTADDVVNQFGHGGSAWKGYTPRSEMPTQAGRPDFSDYEVPYGSPMFRENLAREVEREGLDAPYWQRQREPGERPLTPYENAQLEAQNRRMSPDEETVPQYGYPPEEEFRYQQRLPEDADFQVGDAAPSERPPVLVPMPARRPAGEGLFDANGRAPRAVHEAPTRGGAEPGPLPELTPLDVPDAPAPTVVGRIPQAPTPESIAPPVVDAGSAPTVAQRPSATPQALGPGKVPLYGSNPPTDEEIVYKYLGSLESPAMQRAQAREADAFGELARQGGKAMLDADNPISAAMRGPWAMTREAIRNPAVRARALSALRLRRLASMDPETWGRVGRALEQALQQGPEEYAAAVHVYNQTDLGFREAQRKAAEGLEEMDDERLERELRAAGLL